MEHNKRINTNDYAMRYGLWLGIYQAITGGFFIASLDRPFSAFLVLVLGLSTPIFAFQLMKRFRDNICEGKLSFGQGWKLGTLTFIYAGLIMALVTYVYFDRFDQGSFVAYYARPENMAIIDSIQMGMSGEAFVQVLSTLSPSTYASNMLINNTFIGVFISAIAAVILRK